MFLDSSAWFIHWHISLSRYVCAREAQHHMFFFEHKTLQTLLFFSSLSFFVLGSRSSRKWTAYPVKAHSDYTIYSCLYQELYPASQASGPITIFAHPIWLQLPLKLLVIFGNIGKAVVCAHFLSYTLINAAIRILSLVLLLVSSTGAAQAVVSASR